MSYNLRIFFTKVRASLKCFIFVFIAFFSNKKIKKHEIRMRILLLISIVFFIFSLGKKTLEFDYFLLIEFLEICNCSLSLKSIFNIQINQCPSM